MNKKISLIKSNKSIKVKFKYKKHFKYKKLSQLHPFKQN